MGGPPTLAYVRLSPSMSAQPSVPVWSVSSAPELESAAHVGASLTALTVIDIVAVLESRAPSFALNVKLSGPL